MSQAENQYRVHELRCLLEREVEAFLVDRQARVCWPKTLIRSTVCTGLYWTHTTGQCFGDPYSQPGRAACVLRSHWPWTLGIVTVSCLSVAPEDTSLPRAARDFAVYDVTRGETA